MKYKLWLIIIFILAIFITLIWLSPLTHTTSNMPVNVDSNQNMVSATNGTVTKEIINDEFYIVMNDKFNPIKIKCTKEQFFKIDGLKAGTYYFIFETSTITKHSKLLAVNVNGKW